MAKSRSQEPSGYYVPKELQAPVSRLISRLERAEGPSLRRLWKQRFWYSAPKRSDEVLKLLFAWKVQAQTFGDIDQSTRDRLTQIRHAVSDGKKISPALSLKPGMILTRFWHGAEHRVLVLGEGFEYRGRRYRTLTHIARLIAGPRYTGPHFFGVGRYRPTARPGASK